MTQAQTQIMHNVKQRWKREKGNRKTRFRPFLLKPEEAT